jgi:hypothetical protein
MQVGYSYGSQHGLKSGDVVFMMSSQLPLKEATVGDFIVSGTSFLAVRVVLCILPVTLMTPQTVLVW